MPRIGLGLSIVLFGIPALLLWATTSLLMPPLVQRGWTPQTAWFLAGSLVFVPLLAASLIAAWASVRTPSLARILEHLRVRPMTSADWRLAGFLWPRLPPHPPFLTATALEPGQYYILLLWLPFFAVNIVGEELWWRGFIMPRQEPVFGGATWIVQSVLHTGFHASFGLGLVFILLPTVFALPWAVQRSKNTSVGIVVHGGINGPAFLAISLGLVPA